MTDKLKEQLEKCNVALEEAATELDRLYDLNQELVEALNDLLTMPESDGTFSMGSLRKSIKDRAKDVLKKAKGEQ